MFRCLVKTLIQPNVRCSGQAVQQSQENMGFDSIDRIRVGRLVELKLDTPDRRTCPREIDRDG